MRGYVLTVAAGALLLSIAGMASGQTLGAAFSSDYQLVDLGGINGVPLPYGGLYTTFQDPTGLYIGGAANTAAGALYRIGVTRGVGGSILSIDPGPAVRVADAPYNDGGIVPDPGGHISMAQWPTNRYSQIDTGSGTLINDVDLNPLGVAGSSASLNWVPASHPGAGRMKLVSWAGGQFYDVNYSVGPGGIISVNSFTEQVGSQLPGGPEGINFVPIGSADFFNPSMIVSEYSANNVAVYEMDSDGNPIIGTRRDFLTGLEGAEGAWIDVFSGEFLFSTFGEAQDRVILVRGFAVPGPGALALVGLGGLAATRHRR
jgi:hypothetical protein